MPSNHAVELKANQYISVHSSGKTIGRCRLKKDIEVYTRRSLTRPAGKKHHGDASPNSVVTGYVTSQSISAPSVSTKSRCVDYIGFYDARFHSEILTGIYTRQSGPNGSHLPLHARAHALINSSNSLQKIKLRPRPTTARWETLRIYILRLSTVPARHSFFRMAHISSTSSSPSSARNISSMDFAKS